MQRLRYSFIAVLGLCLLALILGLESWSRQPYWPDAQGYAESVEAGRWVAHPPGYLFFVATGRLAHLLVTDAYRSVQAVSFLAWLFSIPVMFGGLRKITSDWRAWGLTAVFAFSWIPLVICRTGTSHAVDLLLISALLGVVAGPGFQAQKTGSTALFWLLLAVIAGFRLTTLIMMLPLAAVVLWQHRHSGLQWAGACGLGFCVMTLYLLIIHLSGGWTAYSEYARSMAAGNGPSSVLLHGFTGQTLLNVFRSLFWFLSAAGLVFLPSLGGLKWRNPPTQIFLAAIAGPLGLTTFYLATHPGYLAPALPAVFFLAAQTWNERCLSKPPRICLAAALLISLGWFFGFQIIRHPLGKFDAAANGLILQYSRDGVRTSTFRTLSGWLVEAGAGKAVPANRLQDLQEEQARKKRANLPDPK